MSKQRTIRHCFQLLLPALVVYGFLAVLFNVNMCRMFTTGIEYPGDPLLNTWILSWDLHALLTNPLELWNANIFYPYENTLAYSENLILPALLTLPIRLVSDNPVLIYNISYIVGFILSGTCMYLFVWYITRSRLIALCAGIIFIICPFKLAHSSHIQIQHSQWVPLFFLFSYLVFNSQTRRLRYQLSMTFLTACMLPCLFLSNIYYFFFILPVGMLMHSIKLWNTESRFRRRASFLVISIWGAGLLMTLPFVLPYLEVQQQLHLTRPLGDIIHFSARVENYLAYNPSNYLLGNITNQWSGPGIEYFLAPGILISLLAVAACIRWFFSHQWTRIFAWYKKQPWPYMFLDILIVLVGIVCLQCLLGNGMTIMRHGHVAELMGIKLSIHAPTRAVVLFTILCVVRLLLLKRHYSLHISDSLLYIIITAFAFLMSLGPIMTCLNYTIPHGIYRFFHVNIPGYTGLRVPARFGFFVMFGLCILAALFLSYLQQIIRKGILITVFFISLSVLIVVEYLSASPDMLFVYEDRGPVDTWINELPDEPIVELPMPFWETDIQRDILYTFYSTQHWRKLLNGYSGIAPPDYALIAHYMNTFPSELSIRLAQHLGSRYVILHTRHNVNWTAFSPEIKLWKHQGGTWLFEVQTASHIPEPGIPVSTLPTENYYIRSTSHPGNRDLAILNDGYTKKAWRSDIPQEKGMHLDIAFHHPEHISGILLYPGTHPDELARNYALTIVTTNNRLQAITPYYDPISYIHTISTSADHPVQKLEIPPVTVQGIRLHIAEPAEHYPLTLSEIQLIAP